MNRRPRRPEQTGRSAHRGVPAHPGNASRLAYRDPRRQEHGACNGRPLRFGRRPHRRSFRGEAILLGDAGPGCDRECRSTRTWLHAQCAGGAVFTETRASTASTKAPARSNGLSSEKPCFAHINRPRRPPAFLFLIESPVTKGSAMQQAKRAGRRPLVGKLCGVMQDQQRTSTLPARLAVEPKWPWRISPSVTRSLAKKRYAAWCWPVWHA